ncbi:ATP-binding protein [Longimonas halophila]|nr:ATP-binding protein [Longimonas halophila]
MPIAVRLLLISAALQFALWSGYAPATYAQDTVPYHRFTAYEGLSDRAITALAQTENELLWIGTETSLSVFDGHTFRSVTMPDEIGTVYVSDIQPADSSAVWVAASVGEAVRVRGDSVEQVVELGDELIQRILPGPDTTRFLTRTAVWTWTPEDEDPTRQPYGYDIQTPLDEEESTTSGAGVFNADVHPNGTTWIVDGRHGPGVLHDDGTVDFVSGGATGEPGAYWYTLRIAENGRMFALHDEAVYWMDPDSTRRMVEEPLVTDLGDPTYLSVHGTDVYATRGRRIARYDARTLTPEDTLGAQQGLPDVLMARVFQDTRRGLWVGTPEGLLYLRAPHAQHKSTLSGETPIQNVMDFLPQGTDLWARTYGSGLIQLYDTEQHVTPDDQVGWRQRVQSASDTLHALASETRIWYRKPPNGSWTRVRSTNDAVEGVVDTTGTGYFLHEDGLYRYPSDSTRAPTALATWPDSLAYQHDVTLGRSGALIHRDGATVVRRQLPAAEVVDTLGTLTRYAQTEASRFEINERSNIQQMTTDAARRVWATFVYDGGLLRIDASGTAQRLLSNRRVWQVDTVGDSLALASTRQHGLYVLDAETGAVQRQLTEADGLRSSNVMAAHVARDTLYVGHAHGITKLPLRVLGQTEQPPRTLLTGLEVNLNNQPATPNLALEASDRSIGFSFAGVHFPDPQSVYYEYRLLPQDTTWSTTTQGFTRYTNLDPGAYHFQVRARLNDRLAGEAATYAFRIPAYIYEMRSVQGLAALILLMLGWAAYRWRIRRLQRYQQVLEEMVQERTTELREEKRKTEAQAERLAELDDAKNRFFAHVSHEFRTPLSLLLSPLKSALQQVSNGMVELGSRQVHRMVRNAEHVQRLIDQLLDLATLQASRMSVEHQPGDLAALVQRTADAFKERAQGQSIDLDVHRPAQPLESQFDVEKVETIVSNLVDNALKFTPSGGAVTVRVEPSGDRPGYATILVADTGAGLSEAEQDRIFARFERGNRAQEHDEEGLGLGLTLTSELVALHNGTIDVESTPNEGSTFIVHLPLYPTTHLPPQSVRTDIAHPEDASAIEVHSNSIPAAHDAASESNATVLVVEDNAEMLSFLEEELSPHWHVRTAEHGAEGWTMIQNRAPDLVLADVMMPEMNGFALCRAIKEDAELRTLPVLLLTARASNEAKREGLGCGADAYIAKPFDVAALKQRIANHLAARKHLRSRFEEQVSLSSTNASIDRQHLPFMEAVAGAVDEHLDNPDFTVDQLASAVALSRRQCTRRLKDAVDMTPAAFIRHRRIEHAKTLLQTDPETIAEVVYAVGFRSPSHFSKVFREATGQSPSAYRDTHASSEAVNGSAA